MNELSPITDFLTGGEPDNLPEDLRVQFSDDASSLQPLLNQLSERSTRALSSVNSVALFALDLAEVVTTEAYECYLAIEDGILEDESGAMSELDRVLLVLPDFAKLPVAWRKCCAIRLFLRNGDVDQAMATFGELTKCWEELDLSVHSYRSSSKAMYITARIARELNDIEYALRAYVSAFELSSIGKDQYTAFGLVIMSEIAATYWSLGLLEKATEAYNALKDILIDLASALDPFLIVVMRNVLANWEATFGDATRASQFVEGNLERIKELRGVTSEHLADTLCIEANVLIAQERYEEALQKAREAVSFLTELNKRGIRLRDAQIALVWALMNCRRFSESATVLSDLCNQEEPPCELLFLRGVNALYLEKWNDARRLLLSYIESIEEYVPGDSIMLAIAKYNLSLAEEKLSGEEGGERLRSEALTTIPHDHPLRDRMRNKEVIMLLPVAGRQAALAYS